MDRPIVAIRGILFSVGIIKAVLEYLANLALNFLYFDIQKSCASNLYPRGAPRHTRYSPSLCSPFNQVRLGEPREQVVRGGAAEVTHGNGFSFCIINFHSGSVFEPP